MTLLCSSPGACSVPCIIGVSLNAVPRLAELGRGLPGEGGGPPGLDLPRLEHLGGKEQGRRSASFPSPAAEPQQNPDLSQPWVSAEEKDAQCPVGSGPHRKESQGKMVDDLWGS